MVGLVYIMHNNEKLAILSQVVVNNEEYHLHKFPLYIKSDFFRALATSNLGEKDRVELADFPGGGDIFKTVANFCYNMKV